ncbi:hypothetical protein [Extensimonas vulgaris]|uniref:Uncharacterized protein n=1 Tax=Extensimonas vulgaris TaxID=1031594 RepID=A0A369AQ92_9BURK|nr:hypothetical protein [Extensimonas vulgaris]RCX11540.1 hypothetical protein DFR45_10162 [Extensimonas vulgaris]TWI40437.1 hypothetical protein IP95_00619 [Extensimonas vulgaris]TXD16459.1 hypothetical protein FUT63_03385 [Extensimonas vulgaris]
MSTKDITQAKDPLLAASLAALERAAELARQTALQTNTAIVLVQAGRIVRIPAQALREQRDAPAQTADAR